MRWAGHGGPCARACLLLRCSLCMEMQLPVHSKQQCRPQPAGDETPLEPTCQTNKRASAAQQYHPPPTEISTHRTTQVRSPASCPAARRGCGYRHPVCRSGWLRHRGPLLSRPLAHCLIHLACAILLRLQPSLVSMYSYWPPLAVVENATDRHPCERCCRQEGMRR